MENNITCCKVPFPFYLVSDHWHDIAFNYLIANDGVVYEGRGANIRGSAVYG